MDYTVRPIAYIRNDRSEVLDDNWDEITSTVELAQDVPSDALRGLEEFSHVELVFFADWAEDVPPGPWHRRPRGNPDWPDVGVFAQRNKDRPNRLLASIAAIEAVEARSVVVRGLDAINDTPVLDIKPVFSWNRPRGALRVASWSDEHGGGGVRPSRRVKRCDVLSELGQKDAVVDVARAVGVDDGRSKTLDR